MKVGSFLITFNRQDHLRESLRRTLEQTRPPDSILVVDNGDEGATRSVVEKFVDRSVQYHWLGDNLGPATAAAYALRRMAAEGFDWIIWGDDDTPPQTPDTFERLLNLAARNEASDLGGVGAVGARFDWSRGELVRLPDEALKGDVEVDGIGSGLQLMTRADIISRVGLPDSRLFFGFYDPEYCLRIRRAGYRLLIDSELMREYRMKAGRLGLQPKPSLVPTNSENSMWRRYYVTRNYIFMMRKTFARSDLARRETLKALARTVTAWRRGPRYGAAFSKLQLRGVIDGYRGRLGRTVLPKAKQYGASPGADSQVT